MIDAISPFTMPLGQSSRETVPLTGFKAARLGDLLRARTFPVPDGFVVTTAAFCSARAAAGPGPGQELGELEIPEEVSHSIAAALVSLLRDGTSSSLTTTSVHLPRVAVRSSGVSEDLPGASFAGLHESFLDVPATLPEVLGAVKRCWASLYSPPALAYRQARGVSANESSMSVIVQFLVDADAAGVVFTADPLTGRRDIMRIEAVPGLAEGLVAGTVTPHSWTVTPAETRLDSRPGLAPTPPLSSEDVAALARLAAGIAEFFGHPQDIEWCRDESGFQIVQSRPISNLFPIPQVDDERNHVFVSVGHQQMMTDAMAPLGLSVWQRTALRPMVTAGGRLFVDVTDNVIDPPGRSALLNLMGRSDPLVADALTTILDSGFLATPEPATPQVTGESNAGNGAEGTRPTPPPIAPHPAPPLPTDASVVADLIGASTEAIDRLRSAFEGRTGEDLIDFIESDIDDLKRELLDPRSHRVLAAGMEASWWLNDHLRDMLGVVNAADALAQSAPGNVTSEMGLDLLDVADVVRSHPAVLDELRASGSVRRLGDVSGGHEVLTALSAYLDRYGMRCVGEIDITRPRWAEDPDALVPMILANVAAFEVGAHERIFAAGEQSARGARDEYLHQIRALPDGESAATQTAEHIARLRMFVGYREFPKYAIVSRFWIYKQALLTEAHRLVANGAIESPDDIFFLSLGELRNTIRDRSADLLKIARRRRELEDFALLRAPRVLTSRGDMLDGVYREGIAPDGALPGIAASAGVVEGRARVLMRIDDGALDPGDILVTDHTDPSWSPLFVGAAGLVTRVGGQMSHGSVIAREYGLPAVVGVADATTEIRDHDRIRVNGTDGFVEVLERG